MRNQVLVSDDEIPYLDDDGALYLQELRDDRGAFLASAFAPVESDENGITWWTYAGGYVNNTLRYALRVELGERAEVQATNESVKVLSETIPESEFQLLVEKMDGEGYWERPEFLDEIIALLPDYRLSKFQHHLPPHRARQLVADTILNIGDTQSFLREDDGLGAGR